MSAVTIENIIAQANQLPAAERAKLIAELNRESKPEYVVPEGQLIRTDAPFIDRTQEARSEIPSGRIISVNEPYIDRAQEFEWMKKHERDYIGQWVALKGNRLIAHGAIAKEVFAKARELGVPDALVYLVENPDLSYVGF